MTLWEFEKKLYIKSALYGLGMSVYTYFLCLLFKRLTGEAEPVNENETLSQNI